MPRRPRLRIADVPYHVIQRGNNRSACFLREADYRAYLELLHQLAGQHRVAVHAFVLMTNHTHLLMTPASPGAIALLMKALGQRYAQYFNRAYARSGSVWDGRYRSYLVDSEQYLLTCYRYIESNPVRAAMVTHPQDYAWSSYRANAEGHFHAMLTPHHVYSELGCGDKDRQTAYRELFHRELDPNLVDAIRGGNRKRGRPAGQNKLTKGV